MRGLRWSALVAVIATFPVSAPVSAQSTFVGLSAARATYNEVAAENRQEGFGFTGSAGLKRGKLAVEAAVDWRSLSPKVDAARSSLTLKGGSVRARYAVWRSLDLEAGLETRIMTPEFSAQDAAVVTVGLRHEAELASLASIWISGAAVPVSRFNGGGSGGLGLALGFGLRAGPRDAKWKAALAYGFQRIDRTVRGVDVPIQYESLRLGLEYPLF